MLRRADSGKRWRSNKCILDKANLEKMPEGRKKKIKEERS